MADDHSLPLLQSSDTIAPHTFRLITMVIVLLLAWSLRLCCLEAVPPGWRDDELINIHALSHQLLEGQFPLYYTGASGHEPLYHHLHAGVHALLGFNVLSGHILSIVLGTLTIALSYALARRLFGHPTALVSALGLTASFWSLMYSRIALRHVILPPMALAVFYVFWRLLSVKRPQRQVGDSLSLGLLLGLSLYTYPAARLLPALIGLFTVYLALFHREKFERRWRDLLLALVVMSIFAAPLGVAIARGQSQAAAEGIGADARLAELALPLRELKEGNPRPLVETTLGTLGMFHATGDPEWLYNIPGRPVFNLLGGMLLWAGVALCLARWRDPRYAFMLPWLGLGLLPAFLSIPAASLSHTILAQPVAYILPTLSALALGQVAGQVADQIRREHQKRLSITLSYLVCGLFLVTNGARDLRAYFINWPRRGMTRLLYRADYRETADFLNDQPGIGDVMVSSALLGPWDRLALEVDLKRSDVTLRLSNPQRALVWPDTQSEEQTFSAILTTWPAPSSPIVDLLRATTESTATIAPTLTLYEPKEEIGQPSHTLCGPQPTINPRTFTNGLKLTDVCWWNGDRPEPGEEAVLITAWHVAQPLELPPIPIVANPPPPGVYSGPRLAVFAHLLDADEGPLAIDDGLWVDPLTLRLGDRFVQIHRFTLAADAPQKPHTLALGLYDPKTGQRWSIDVKDGSGQTRYDQVILPIGEN